MSPPPARTARPASRSAATQATLVGAALEEIGTFGFRRASMEGVARRAGVSRATVYAYWASKEELFRSLVQHLHDEHLTAMTAAADDASADFERRLLAVLEARFLKFVTLTSTSPHGAEFYDLHSRLCGDIARDSQERSERVLTSMLRKAVAAGEADLAPAGLIAAQAAGVIFDCALGAKGEDTTPAMTPELFRTRLARAVRLLTVGLSPTKGQI